MLRVSYCDVCPHRLAHGLLPLGFRDNDTRKKLRRSAATVDCTDLYAVFCRSDLEILTRNNVLEKPPRRFVRASPCTRLKSIGLCANMDESIYAQKKRRGIYTRAFRKSL